MSRSGSDLSYTDLERLRHAFLKYDVNGDGQISREELKEVLKSLGSTLSEASVDQLVTEIDLNHDGYVDFEEFCLLEFCAAASCCSDKKRDDLVAAFRLFDSDNDGYITASELHAVMVGMGDKDNTVADCKRMIEEFDTNGDGKVDLIEFEEMMKATSG